MVFKDERKTPQVKKLRLAFADGPAGPWRTLASRSPGIGWKGPRWRRSARSAIYFDHYPQPQHYGAMRTTDSQQFQDVSSQVSFRADPWHNTDQAAARKARRR
jgi:hypothetical protein